MPDVESLHLVTNLLQQRQNLMWSRDHRALNYKQSVEEMIGTDVIQMLNETFLSLIVHSLL